MPDLDGEFHATRNQAYGSLDRVEETLDARDYEDALAAAQRLLQRIEELQASAPEAPQSDP